MYDILKTSVNGTHPLSFCDTLPGGPPPDPQDLWLFTDPVARAVYSHENRLDQLEHDICSYAMYEGRWAPDELELKHEIQRLLRENTLIPKGTFGHLSPHPTVYRAICGGALEVAGYRHHFGAGNDILFEPWLARASNAGLRGPVRVGRLQHTTRLCLCCEAFPRAAILCERALAILRQTRQNRRTDNLFACQRE